MGKPLSFVNKEVNKYFLKNEKSTRIYISYQSKHKFYEMKFFTKIFCDVKCELLLCINQLKQTEKDFIVKQLGVEQDVCISNRTTDMNQKLQARVKKNQF